MAGKTGRFAIIEQFLADGIDHMFGNPGTVEQGFLDVLSEYPNFKYILTLQETVALAIADGYTRATKKPTVVQLHSGVGLGNGIGMLYQAKRGHAPLVVINGEAGIRYDAMDAQMAAQLVEMARPVTKWATRVVDPTSLLRVLRRAIKIAATPPMGPVFVCLPMDVLDALQLEDVIPTSLPSTRALPESQHLLQAAQLLKDAQRPMIIMGDGVATSAAQEELTRVAEILGAEVWGADSSEVNMSAAHPLFKGQLGHMFGEHSRAITTQADAVLICGTYVFPEVFPALSEVFARDAKVVHIDLDAYEIAKNFPVDLGLVSDPKATLARLATALQTSMNADQKAAAQTRITRHAAEKEQEKAHQDEANQARRDTMPLHASQFMEELAAQLPSDAVIFDEALTTSPDLVHYLPPTQTGSYFLTRGGSLGVGLPGALGLKLAHPDKTVIGFSGDGGSMYTIQALWTAAHHKIGAKFVICNNHSYELLKLNIQQYWRERDLPEREFPTSFELTDPAIRFDELAQALGVQSARVETPEQIAPAIRQALATDDPFLIELIITNEVPDHIVHKAVNKYGIA
ncbi:thiamine pyrophosphate-binding protein [Dictyobacter arantiisoli]|uniref:Benzoylformate decarboxylase n=1 Tax=Dictyobacter arantiisoli TaxID=2014874 RepID=A0A5A5T995_9CHLR|nr:thiamine pyrophosphate-binding protein [Dictyobacter arantiisoli]GCF07958.1 benzoylformate decarboxylase [Dictyobacter arantiisoli]